MAYDPNSTLETALIANPGPWKARSRAPGERMRAALPWEVTDATGNRVALCASAMAASLLCRAVNQKPAAAEAAA